MVFAFDLPHYVHHVRLTKADALTPLFEAIINSIQAVQERGIPDGVIDIHVNREPQQTLAEDGEKPLILGFSVVDNGAGFTEKNMASFTTFSSSLKVAVGGKGVGRFVWLKVFSRVRVESTYSVDGGTFQTRRFLFRLDPQGIHDGTVEKVETAEYRTTVTLEDMRREFAEAIPTTGETIARRILDHCMIYLMQQGCPRITLYDADDKYTINSLFSETIRLHGGRSTLRLNDYDFQVFDLQRSPSAGARHRVHLCAHSREVVTENLSSIVPELQGRLINEQGEPYFISSYVLSPYLDAAVNAERTAVSFDRADSLLAGAVTDTGLYTRLAEHIRRRFGKAISDAASDKVAEYSRFIENQAPEFRIVLSYLDELRRLPANLSTDKLRVELFRIKGRLRADLKEEGVRLLAEPPEARSEEEYKERMSRFAEDWNRLGVSELANYVIHRKVMLDFLEASLRRNDGSYRREEAIHRFILPLRLTSNEVEYEQQNLWMIDERLAYHQYLASDKPLRSLEIGEFEGLERPDLIVFNRSHLFVEQGFPLQSVEIVEFKRPMRDDYTDEDNPILQVREYIRRLRAGKELDQHGRLIPITPSTAYYAYIVCDITPRLADLAEGEQFSRTPDGMGFFLFHKTYNALIQIIGFSKLLDDARKRNNVLFDKLNLPQR